MAKKYSFCLSAMEKTLPLPLQYKKVIYMTLNTFINLVISHIIICVVVIPSRA